MSAAVLLLPFLLGLVFAAYALLRDPLHPLFVIIGSFALLILLNFAFADAVNFYPLQWSGVGAILLGLTALAAGAVAGTLAVPPTRGPEAPLADRRAAIIVAAVLFVLSLASTAWYWIDVSNHLGLANIVAHPGRLKAAELTGTINSNSVKYFFRGVLIVPVALTMAVVLNPDRRLPKLMLGTFLLMSLVQVRRDPIVITLSAALATALILQRDRRRLLVPLAVGVGALLVMSIALLLALRSLNFALDVTLFGYTAGHLSSFQALLDGFYPETFHYPAERTLYFFYSAFKYLNSAVAPSPVVKPNPTQPLLPNTYTFLSDFYLDLGIVGLVVAPLLIGIFMAVSYSLAMRRPSFVTLSLFAAIYGVSVMSFMNNEWSWLQIPTTPIFAGIATMVLLNPARAAVSIWSRRARKILAPV